MKKLAVLSVFIWGVLAGINWDIYEHGVVDTFRWSRPFPDDGTDPGGFHVHCKAEGTFHAKMYKLSDLIEPEPLGLQPWRFGIEEFLARRGYPGSWDGVDHKDQNREIVVMEYVDVPEPVRHWIEEQQRDVFEETIENGQKVMRKKRNDRKWLFGIFAKPKRENQQINDTVAPKPTDAAAVDPAHDIKDEDKIVVFAAGAAYEILPLWVSKGSKCERAMSNLTKYKHQAEDDTILAWVTDHTKPKRDLDKRDITFKVEAMEVTESEEGKRSRLMWEKLHRTLRRNERRMQKEERMKVRRELTEGRIKDEL
ncbi:hypothetical protein QBC47DRAFT_434706 [Echria macrotheca]|uniref:Uncharacterized protein n=1 Tax=Echria macrotheca TaxID=438768 RepID=A0AAJ0F7V0_9PEZI|nr:hypothetical protein QBC47DRAFT_434706 [Echria macrotheca]